MADTLTISDDGLAQLIEAVCAGAPVNPSSVETRGPTYICIRAGGRRQVSGWYEDEYLASALLRAVGDARENGKLDGADMLEVCLTHDFDLVSAVEGSKVFANRHRGLRGIEIRDGDRVYRVAPTEMLATNRSFERAIERIIEPHGVTLQAALETMDVRRFDARQCIVSLKAPVRVTTIHRGNKIVWPGDLSMEVFDGMISEMVDWMCRHVSAEGRMTYKYWPSRGEESRADNTIRQFMATLCLIRAGAHSRAPDVEDNAARNLECNLDSYFRAEDSIGMIVYGDSAKLGAAALAALCILEAGIQDREQERFDLLCRGVEALWSSDGAFRTFHKPASRNDNQNFYPGEALLFWATWFAETGDEDLLAKLMLSFEYYRDFHRRNPNPAFIPWHTQAYVRLYEHSGSAELRDFVFEMNDWLLDMQQWETAPYPDLRGRFYHPERPDYGPPHASATGAYLEGLVAAYRIARSVGEQERMEKYARAIWRGLRSICQLQFRDPVEMFYISRKSRVRGAIRTEVYDNEIRVDNIQHALMALLELRSFSDFPPNLDA
jgi:hypothetical protein